MTEHTQEPWTMGKGPLHENEIFGVDRVDGSRQLVARVYGYSAEEVRANMRRITACVKACQGIPTETLEAGVVLVPVDVIRRITETTRYMDATGSKFHWIDAADVDVLKAALSRLQQNGGADHD